MLIILLELYMMMDDINIRIIHHEGWYLLYNIFYIIMYDKFVLDNKTFLSYLIINYLNQV